MSVWYCRRQNKVQHCRIKLKQTQDGSTKYFLVGPKSFDNLYSLINHYQLNPLRSDKFEMTLNEPVPQVRLPCSQFFFAGKRIAEKPECLQFFFVNFKDLFLFF